jgi:hypothetical protein
VLVPLDSDELDESGLVLDELLSVSIVPLSLLVPDMVESCDAVPVAAPPCGYCDDVPLCSEPELDVAELPCADGVELSVTLPETLVLDDDELGVVEFKLPDAEVDPLGAPAPEVLIDVLL